MPMVVATASISRMLGGGTESPARRHGRPAVRPGRHAAPCPAPPARNPARGIGGRFHPPTTAALITHYPDADMRPWAVSGRGAGPLKRWMASIPPRCRACWSTWPRAPSRTTCTRRRGRLGQRGLRLPDEVVANRPPQEPERDGMAASDRRHRRPDRRSAGSTFWHLPGSSCLQAPPRNRGPPA